MQLHPRQVVIIAGNRCQHPARVRIEGRTDTGVYSGIQLGMGYRPGVTVLPPLRVFRAVRVVALRVSAGWQLVLPGVVE